MPNLYEEIFLAGRSEIATKLSRFIQVFDMKEDAFSNCEEGALYGRSLALASEC